jgi:hypothetical protein
VEAMQTVDCIANEVGFLAVAEEGVLFGCKVEERAVRSILHNKMHLRR